MIANNLPKEGLAHRAERKEASTGRRFKPFETKKQLNKNLD
jgi:hypothetical protein